MKFVLGRGGIAPFRATKGSAAFDLFLPDTFEKTAIFPGYPTMIDFQVKVAIPFGWAGLLLPRSGLGTKKGLQLHNTAGLIDSDYRNNLMAVLSLKERGTEREPGEPFIIRPGDRLAQLVLFPCYMENLEHVFDLPDPGTREGGYGSTGLRNENVTASKDFSKLQISKVPGKAREEALDSGKKP